MLKDILQRAGLSVYKVSKDTGIAYTTLNDIVIEKTDLKNASAALLYRLSKYLEVSMEYLYEDSLQNNIEKNIDINIDKNINAKQEKYAPLVGIWWWTGHKIIGVSKEKDSGANIDGLIHYSETENHVTLWKKILRENVTEEEFSRQYEKGFKSMYRGRVYYDPRTACYEITCSKNVIDDNDFREEVIKYYHLENTRKEFVALHHYEYIRELTGNAAVDADYYESSF